MKRWRLLFVTGLLCVAGPVAAQQTPPQPAALMPPGSVPQIVAFDNQGLLGDHLHIFGNTTDLGKWGTSISSLVILTGRWEFFDEEDCKGAPMTTLGPGIYVDVKAHGMKDNRISSMRLAGPGGQ